MKQLLKPRCYVMHDDYKNSEIASSQSYPKSSDDAFKIGCLSCAIGHFDSKGTAFLKLVYFTHLY